MNIRGEVKSLQVIHGRNGDYLLATINNEKPVIYLLRK
jgi:hypothetical protein